MDIFDKCARATAFESGLKESGHYFFFSEVESRRILTAVVNGKK